MLTHAHTQIYTKQKYIAIKDVRDIPLEALQKSFLSAIKLS